MVGQQLQERGRIFEILNLVNQDTQCFSAAAKFIQVVAFLAQVGQEFIDTLIEQPDIAAIFQINVENLLRPGFKFSSKLQ